MHSAGDPFSPSVTTGTPAALLWTQTEIPIPVPVHTHLGDIKVGICFFFFYLCADNRAIFCNLMGSLEGKTKIEIPLAEINTSSGRCCDIFKFYLYHKITQFVTCEPLCVITGTLNGVWV